MILGLHVLTNKEIYTVNKDFNGVLIKYLPAYRMLNLINGAEMKISIIAGNTLLIWLACQDVYVSLTQC